MSANMLSQRAIQLSSRRLTAANPSMFSKTLRMAFPASIAMGQTRFAATTSSANTNIVSQSEGYEILAAQRKLRPVAPHLGIYKPQITWYASGLNRLTGVILSGTFYLYGIGYLVAPYIGLHLESASLAASFAAFPIAVKILLKAVYALPFTFHSFNGLRHLTWDTGAAFTNKQVIVTGWTVVAVSVLTALGLTFY